MSDLPIYKCCEHCASPCFMADEHELACIKGCIPYASTRQPEEGSMSQPDTENIAAEALQETLEFERAQWEHERKHMRAEIDAGDFVSREDENFIVSQAAQIGHDLVHEELALLDDSSTEEAVEALSLVFKRYIDGMPTPSKAHLKAEVQIGQRDLAIVIRERSILASHLDSMGIDPVALIAAKDAEDQDFISTIMAGFSNPFDQQMSAGFTDDEIEADEDPDA